MTSLKKAAELHKKKFVSHVHSNGISVEIRQPLSKESASSSVAKIMGTTEREVEPGESQTLLALFLHPGSTNSLSYVNTPEKAPLGRVKGAERILKVVLQEALKDVNKPHALTIFDTAKDVVIQGSIFKVLGTDKTGLPGIDPYVLWVALKGIGEDA